MANRVLTAGDIVTMPWYSVGDIYFDTPTSYHADGKWKIDNTNADATFPTAALGCRIIIDIPGESYFLRIRADSASDVTEWAISDATHYVRVIPGNGRQLKCTRNASSNGGFLMLIANIKYCIIDGETDPYPGLRDGWPGVFLTNHFGIKLSGGIYPAGGHHISISSPDGGHFIVKGIECQGGFAGIRYAGGDYDLTVKITILRCYLHSSGDSVLSDGGEGIYVGATHAYPYVLLECEIDDCVISRRSCEGIQVQHIISGANVHVIQDSVNFCPAMDGIRAFQGGQDTAIQWSQGSGGNIIKNLITDGSAFSSMGLAHFGTVDYPGLESVDETVPSRAENCLFHRIGGIMSYIHNSNTSGVWKMMRGIYLLNFSNRYYYETINTLDDYYVSAHNGSDRFSWIDVVHDGAKTSFFENDTDHEYIDIVEDVALDDPEYMNAGNPEPTSDVMNWKDVYAGYHNSDTGSQGVTYLEGWIVANIEDGYEYAIYKVMQTHTTSLGSLNPRAHIAANGETHYKKCTWDESGVRNLLLDGTTNPSWASGDTQSLIPPDDLRLVADSYWNKKGMGLKSNPLNTDYTQYRWYRNSSASVTGAVIIPGAKTRFYKAQDVDRGKYIAMGVRAKGSTYDSSFRVSNWTLVS
jgi:hypothetical protein